MKQKLTLRLLSFVHFRSVQANHYEVLGVNPDATLQDIKKKYYQLAKICHPDVSSDPNSNQKFTKITIAYQTLTDEEKRKQYDRENPIYVKRQTKRKQQQKSSPGFSARYRSHKQKHAKNEDDEDPFMAFDQFFKNNRSYARPKRGSDANINLTISLEESILGVNKQITYTQQQLCLACSEREKQQCFACGGKGAIFNRIKRDKQQCINCNGKGFINDCQTCQGTSFVRKDVVQNVYIPKNTHNKSILRLEGLGNHGFRSSNGDLYLTVLVENSTQFKVDGNNIHSEVHLDYLKAILGGKVMIKTVYGAHQVNIQAGTQSGKQIRLFNLGLTSQYSKRRGDHIVVFKIKVPSNLNSKQKALFEQLRL